MISPASSAVASIVFVLFPASSLPVDAVHFPLIRTVSLVIWYQTGRTNERKKKKGQFCPLASGHYVHLWIELVLQPLHIPPVSGAIHGRPLVLWQALTSLAAKATFPPRRPQSGPNKETMIRAVIQPFHTTLSRSAECQHKFADTHSSIFTASPDALFLFICIIPVTLRLITLVWFAYLWLKLRTGVHTVNTVQQETSCCLWVWGDKDLQGGGWTWSILRFNPILTYTDRQCLQCTLQSPILC